MPYKPHKSLILNCAIVLSLFAFSLPLSAQKAAQKTTQKTTQKAPQKSTQKTSQKKSTQKASQSAPQESKRVKDLKQQQSQLKNELQKSQVQLDKTRKQVKTGEQNVDFLGLQLNNRLKRIHQLEAYRIIYSNDGHVWYTEDHYNTFTEMSPSESASIP